MGEKYNFKHGLYRTSEYKAWATMIQRCHNPNEPNYQRYGARGIEVCDRWRKSSTSFLADMGPKPSPAHSLERIDNSGNYAPGNCRWALRAEQNRNTRRTHLLTFRGESRPMKEWAMALGIKSSTLEQRINRYRWSVEDALTLPAHKGVTPRHSAHCKP